MPEQTTGHEAREAHMRYAALRAVDDPVTLAKAARIVRAALERGRLTRADLDGPIVQPLPASISAATDRKKAAAHAAVAS